MAECIRDPALENKVLPIGGPGEAMSALQQGTMLFEILDMEPKFVKVPIEVMDGVIKVLDTFAGFRQHARRRGVWQDREVLRRGVHAGDGPRDGAVRRGRHAVVRYGHARGFFKKVSVEGLAGQELGDQAVFKSKD